MHTTISPLAACAALAILATTPLAVAQEWTLDRSLETFSEAELEALKTDVIRAPERALTELLKEEGEHLEGLGRADVREFGYRAWKRLTDAKLEGHLARQYVFEFKKAGVLTNKLAHLAWREERKRLHTVSERAVNRLVQRALRAVLLDRLEDVRNARLEVAHFGNRFENDVDVRTHMAGTAGHTESGVATRFPYPNVRFFSEKHHFEKALYDKTWKTKVGDLHVTAAKFEGLYMKRAGRVTYKDAFGHKVKGYGAEFRATATVTGIRNTFTSKEIMREVGKDLGMRAHLSALAKVSSTVDLTATSVINHNGAGFNLAAGAGTGATADIRLPVTIDLKVITIRVIPYARAHAGASAEAHATFEVEWSGKVRMDLGATVSTGGGVGAGIIVEIELGPVLKRALERLIERLAVYARPIADFFMGRKWQGPNHVSDTLTIGIADMENAALMSGAPRPKPKIPTEYEAIANRYAPVFYQEVTREQFDFIRRVDFDGDWNTLNNWDNATPESDSSAHVYYDVRETESHYYVSYVVYHAGRKSNAILGIDAWRRHENDMGGCIVVVRKDAAAGREVETLITASGSSADFYSGMEDKNEVLVNWSKRHAGWDGWVRFIDEVDHPAFDLERTHPQVWINGKTHEVHGFNGRDDRDPFSGDHGVIYYPNGAPERPESIDDNFVGYALRPLAELVAQTDNENVFTTDDLTRVRDGYRSLPRRLRGDEGPDDQAVPPWAWRHWSQDEDHDDDDEFEHHSTRTEYVEEGDLFIDPARVLSVLFKTPEDFSRTWLVNPYRFWTPGADGIGLLGGLEESAAGQPAAPLRYPSGR
jgi:hypothetical protein